MITSGVSESSRKIDLEQSGFPLPIRRPHRLRTNPVMCAMTAETTLTPEDLILPIPVADGTDEPKSVSSLPGVVQHIEDPLVEIVREAIEVGVSAVGLFGVPLDADKNGEGPEFWNSEGALNRALRRPRDKLGNDILVMAGAYLDELTDHEHCGVLGTDRPGDTVVKNDHALINHVKMVVAQADASAHIVPPSGIMDGQIATTREGLDTAGYEDVSIMAYSTKYVSAFYDSFREAVDSSLQDDRRVYQQNPTSRCESLLEVQFDANEGADMVMVKPAMSYLDILCGVVDMSSVSAAVYRVPDEHVMTHAAAVNGWVDLDAVMVEVMLSIHRVGAEQILTYVAVDLVKKLRAQF